MRRILFGSALAFLIAVPAANTGLACGDKFLRTGFGILQQTYAPKFSAAVLVFAPPGSTGAALLKEQKFQAALEKAGHKLVVVKDEAHLRQVMRPGEFDLALGALDDRSILEAELNAASAPTLLFVQGKQKKAEVEACKQQYDCQLKTSDRLDEYLKHMDDAMKVRLKAGKSH